jgi:hypothetical protein
MASKRSSHQPQLPGFSYDFAEPPAEPAEVPSLPSGVLPEVAKPPPATFVSRVTPPAETATVSHPHLVSKRPSAPSLFDSPPADETALVAATPTPRPVTKHWTERITRHQSLFDFDSEAHPEVVVPPAPPTIAPTSRAVAPQLASGEKGKARDLLAAIRVSLAIEQENRSATEEEQATLAKFPGFGPLALRLFPDPVTGKYLDDSWQRLGDELQALLSPDEYTSAKRTTFNAFYTSPIVIRGIFEALAQLGVPADARVLEPGCGSGNFLALAPPSMHFTGVELDTVSGRIARARHPDQDIRVEDFRDTRLLRDLDAVVGNVPFADVKYDFHGEKLALHDYFVAKSLDALAPGGILAVVTSNTPWAAKFHFAEIEKIQN